MTLSGKISYPVDWDKKWTALGDAWVPKGVSAVMAGSMGEPDASIQFEVRNGRPECIEFLVKAKPDGRGIRSGDLTMLNLDSIAEGVFLTWASRPGGGKLGGDGERERWSLRKEIDDAIKAPGRGPSEAELREVARIYREHPKAPTNAVEKLLRLSRRTASRRVSQARDAGLL